MKVRWYGRHYFDSKLITECLCFSLHPPVCGRVAKVQRQNSKQNVRDDAAVLPLAYSCTVFVVELWNL